MAIINGTAAGDFIHRNGDGIVSGGNEINTVTTLADSISGLAGDDLIYGDTGNDTILGGDGFDRIYGGGGADNLSGGIGNDEFHIIQLSDIDGLAEAIDGGADLDSLIFDAVGAANISLAAISNLEQMFFRSDVTLTAAQLGGFSRLSGDGGTYERLIISNAGAADLTGCNITALDEIRGNDLVNQITMTGVFSGMATNLLGGADVLNGSDGIDLADGGAGNDTLNGSLGDDALRGAADADRIDGGDGSDIIRGGAGLDNMTGGIGNDQFRMEFVSDVSGLAETINGGDDFDRIDFGIFGAFGAVNLTAAVITNVEELSLFGNDATLTAAQLGAFVSLTGNGGQVDRVIMAGAGIVDLTGANILSIEEIRGSSGVDQINLTAVANGLFVDTRAGNDRITGTDSADLLLGGDDNDSIAGNAGNDNIRGGQGIDTLLGGVGYDIFQIQGVSEISGLAEQVNGGADVDRLDFQIFSAFGAANLTTVIFTALEELQLFANDVTMTGAQISAFDAILGNGGQVERVILSAAGVIDMSNGVSTIDEYRGTAGGDAFNFTNVATGQFLNTLGGADNVVGSVGNDFILGGDGNDSLHGSTGSDAITGGLNVDRLTGGLGVDTFDYNDTVDTGLGALADTITDFVHGTDVINLADVDADSGTGGNQAFIFIGVAGFAFGAAGRLRYAGGSIFGEINGDAVADFQIILTGAPVVTASDFLL